jgi:hypothetical protein
MVALPPVFFDGRAASKIHFNFIFSKNQLRLTQSAGGKAREVSDQ